eukprot:Gb_09767 [translate_table: standard]
MIYNIGDGSQISPGEIVTHIPTINIYTTITLDQILKVLFIHLGLRSSVKNNKNGNSKRFYGLNPFYKYLMYNKDGVFIYSLVLLNQDKVLIEC